MTPMGYNPIITMPVGPMGVSNPCESIGHAVIVLVKSRCWGDGVDFCWAVE